ncbi:MAG: universal stress protein [Desulfobacterales bacterium]
MSKTIHSILFASDLTENCQTAFEMAFSLAENYKAKLILLHVIEKKLRKDIEDLIESAVGEQKWINLQEKEKQYIQQKLVGKISSESLIHTALREYCHDAGINRIECRIPSYETIVVKGNIIDSILETSVKQKCDIIVLGARKGFLKNNSLGLIVKGVMRQSKIPVIFVPPQQSITD